MSAIKKARCESQTSTLSDLTPIQLISWRRLPRCPATIGGNERTPAVHFLSRIAVALEPMNLLVIFKQTECRRWFRLHFRHADWLSEYLIRFSVFKTDRCSIWKKIDIIFMRYSFIILYEAAYLVIFRYIFFTRFYSTRFFTYLDIYTSNPLGNYIYRLEFLFSTFFFLIHTCIFIVDWVDGKTVNSATARLVDHPEHSLAFDITHQAGDIICSFGHGPNNNTKQWGG